MKKNNIRNLYIKRQKVLKIAKKIAPLQGWNEKIFELIAKEIKVPIYEILALFPNYIDLLKFYLDDVDNKMIKSVKKLNIKKLRTHEKIFKIIITRIEKNLIDKKLIQKTLFILSLPQNINISIYSLYRTVDHMWYLASDKSYNFNYYTKRMILAYIYTSVLIFWMNDKTKNLNKTKIYLSKKMQNTTSLGKIKNLFKGIIYKSSDIFCIRKIFKKTS